MSSRELSDWQRQLIHVSGFASVITILVGTGQKKGTFVLHEHLLRKSSTFFDNALKGEWKEANEKVVRIPETSSESFAIYVRFIFTGFLFIRTYDQPHTNNQDSSKETVFGCATMDECLIALKLADFLQALDFRDAILDAMMEVIAEIRVVSGYRFSFTETALRIIYDHSAVNSPMRSFTANLCLHAWGCESYATYAFAEYPLPFFSDLLKAAGPFLTSDKKAWEMSDPIDPANSCKYHEHTMRGEPCYKAKYQYITTKMDTTGKHIILKDSTRLD